jgi:segregation and condensation protein B
MSKPELSEIQKRAMLEAILFAYGEPMEREKLSTLLGVEQEAVGALVESLKDEYARQERGLMIIQQQDGRVMLATKPQFGEIIESFIKEELKGDLTPAVAEALALVSYFGPISRAEIDYIRGVNSSFILRQLLIRGLVERTQKGHAYLYTASVDFLKHVGVSAVTNLPDYRKYQDIKQKYFENLSAEVTTPANDVSGGAPEPVPHTIEQS